jgi:hypothetical protein
VLAPGYRPDLAGLAGDYLAANPTRDRGLDLLPVLLHLDPARVRAALPREKVGARPALHYRLPRARVGEPGWGIGAGLGRLGGGGAAGGRPRPAGGARPGLPGVRGEG